MKSLKEILQSEELEAFEIKPKTEEEEYQVFLMDIIAQVVKLRVDRGLTQTELARLADLKQSAISRFENLGTNPSLKFLFKLLKAMDGKIEIAPKERKRVRKEIHVDLIKPSQKSISEIVINRESKTWRETEIWKAS